MGYELVVIGTSLGGLHALGSLLASLPPDFGVPLAVVQHRRRGSDDTLKIVLQEFSLLTILEAEDKMPIQPGHVYIAPADYHLLAEKGHFALSTEGPVAFSRPSIDVLFESAAHAYQANLVGVVLTGANRDGSRGAIWIKRCGGYLLVQAPETAESPVMPEATIAATAVDRILPLPEIARALAQITH